ncbi:MAG: hypothetical protein RLZZ440_1584 [Planctomycetota bacterium]
MHESITPNPSDTSRLIAGHLDGCLSADEQARLNQLVATEQRVAVELARAAMLHDTLRDLLRHEADTGGREETPVSASRGPVSRPGWPLTPWLAGLAAAACVVLAILAQLPGGTAQAAAALDRLVVAAAAPVDREYRISVLDPGPGGSAPPVRSGGKGRKPGVDGARLFVRGADRFVLIRRFGDGTDFITGSDGGIGWAVPPKGPVHLSHDTRRFRRGLPGEHEEVPFLDLRSGFEGLRRGYDLTVAEQADGSHLLEARRRSLRKRGPEFVQVWFDDAGVAVRIQIEGLPVEDGMPAAVALTLVAQDDLGEGFYAHDPHHSADRRISWE